MIDMKQIEKFVTYVNECKDGFKEICSIKWKNIDVNKIPLHERNIVVKILPKFLELLEWHILSEVDFEGSVKILGEKTKLVDAAIIVNRKYKLLVEVKPSLGKITTPSLKQILRYLQNSHAPYGIVMNQDKILFCRKFRVRKGYGNPNYIFEMEFKDFTRYPHALFLFSKQCIINNITNKAIEIAKKEMTEKRERIQMEEKIGEKRFYNNLRKRGEFNHFFLDAYEKAVNNLLNS